MKYIILISFSFCLMSRISAQLPPESDPHRGIYFDSFLKTVDDNGTEVDVNFSTLSVDTNRDGIFEKEDRILNYACENHITYITLYDQASIIGKNIWAWNENIRQYEKLEKHLCRFITKAKNEYGVTQVGAVGGSAKLFDSLETFMERYPVTPPYRLSNEMKNSPYFNPKLYIVEKDSLSDKERVISEKQKFSLRLLDFNTHNECEADYDVLNVEDEFWGNCMADLPRFITIIESMYSLKMMYNAAHPDNPLITEAYLAFLDHCTAPGLLQTAEVLDGCKTCSPFPGLANPHPPLIDRVCYSQLQGNPYNWSFSSQNYFEHPDTQDSTDFHPMLYSGGPRTGSGITFMGPWLESDPRFTIFWAEDYYYYAWKMSSGTTLGQPTMNDVQPGGVQWFAASHMAGVLDDPLMVQTPSPFCAPQDSALITLTYHGPDDFGTDYEFYISRDTDNAVVYPQAGGVFTGTSKWTFPDPGKRAIDFTDTLLFPPLYLPKGNFTAHLLLKYNHSNGCTYSCEHPVLVDDRPRIHLAGDSAFCSGDHTFLTATAGATTYSWYRNGVMFYSGPGSVLKVTETGDYFCELSGGSCTSFTDTFHITVHPLPPLLVNVECHGNGTVAVKTYLIPAGTTTPYSSGTGGVTYKWNTGETTDQILIPAGASGRSYKVVVTDPYSGCEIIKSGYVTDILQPSFNTSITVTQQPTSSCSSDGILTAQVTPAPLPYETINYLWSDGETTATITGKPPGNYSVAVEVYRRGCSSYATVALGTSPTNAPALNAIVTDASCHNTFGSVVLNPVGGNPPFTFEWDYIPDENGYHSTDRDQLQLYPGLYTVHVTDVNGCHYQESFRVGETNSVIVVEEDNVIAVTGCGSGMNGSATVNVSGSSGNYTEEWIDNFHVSQSSGNNLHAGSYRVVVTDQNGCTGYGFVSVPSETILLETFLLDSSETLLTCDTAADGKVYLEIHGGRAPYTVSQPWSIDSNLVYRENLAAGTYSFSVTDSGGCVFTDSVIISSPGLTLSTYATPTSCIGCLDGTITLTNSGGKPPYAISWWPLAGVLDSSVITQLPGGVYMICITDSNQCMVCVSDTVPETPTGIIPKENKSSFGIFPNPAKDYLIFNSENIVERFIISDLVGKTMNHLVMRKGTGEINISKLDAGIYIITTDAGSAKFVKL